MLSKFDSWLYEKGFYHFIKKILESGWIQFFTIILIILNAYILYLLGNETDANKFKQNFKFLADIVFNYSNSIVLLSSLISATYVGLTSFVNKKCENLELKYNELNKMHDIVIKILEKLEVVVVEKRKRFALASKQLVSAPQTPKHKTVFDKITQPNKQIELLNEALRDCLISIYPDDFIKVALMRVKNKTIDGWVCHSPYDTKPRTSIQDLGLSNSTFSKCIELNRTIIISNTQTEIKKQNSADIMFIQGQTDPNEIWCQICAPIHSINSNEIIFIISIAIKRENVIVEGNLEFLEWLLKFFKSRLALEHSLAEVKEKISPESASSSI